MSLSSPYYLCSCMWKGRCLSIGAACSFHFPPPSSIHRQHKEGASNTLYSRRTPHSRESSDFLLKNRIPYGVVVSMGPSHDARPRPRFEPGYGSWPGLFVASTPFLFFFSFLFFLYINVREQPLQVLGINRIGALEIYSNSIMDMAIPYTCTPELSSKVRSGP